MNDESIISAGDTVDYDEWSGLLCRSKKPTPGCILRNSRIPYRSVRFSSDRLPLPTALPRGQGSICSVCPHGEPQMCCHYRMVCIQCDASTSSAKRKKREEAQKQEADLMVQRAFDVLSKGGCLRKVNKDWCYLLLVHLNQRTWWYVGHASSDDPYGEDEWDTKLVNLVSKFGHLMRKQSFPVADGPKSVELLSKSFMAVWDKQRID